MNMSKSDVKSNLLRGLTQDEITVECLVREIDMTSTDWMDTLLEILEIESQDPSTIVTRPHTTEYQEELKKCSKQSVVFTKLLEDERISTSDSVRDLKTRIRHWRDRTFRLKGCMHQDNEVDQLINHWRRIQRSYELRIDDLNEELDKMSQNPTLVETISAAATDLNLEIPTKYLPLPCTSGSVLSLASPLYTRGNSNQTNIIPKQVSNVTWSQRQQFDPYQFPGPPTTSFYSNVPPRQPLNHNYSTIPNLHPPQDIRNLHRPQLPTILTPQARCQTEPLEGLSKHENNEAQSHWVNLF